VRLLFIYLSINKYLSFNNVGVCGEFCGFLAGDGWVNEIKETTRRTERFFQSASGFLAD